MKAGGVMSNTSIGRGEKGSKYWMQTLILNSQVHLLNAIKGQLPKIRAIKWKSPIATNNYKELKTEDITEIKGAKLDFWPDNGPWWDAVGIADDGTVLLVEAKAHITETKSKCTATSEKSQSLIKASLMETHKRLAIKGHLYDAALWYSKYYQLANRLTFLNNLTSQGYNVKLILLNIINDPTYIKTSDVEWNNHYKDVFDKMLGCPNVPQNVILLNIKV